MFEKKYSLVIIGAILMAITYAVFNMPTGQQVAHPPYIVSKLSFAVSAPYTDTITGTESGRIYALDTLGILLWKFDGLNAYDYAGWALDVNKVNSDHTVDVIVGQPWHALARGNVVVLNGLTGAPLWSAQGSYQPAHFFGASVSGGGDVNGDNIPDVLVGEPLLDTAQGTRAGTVYAFDGQTGALHWKKNGNESFDHFGFGVKIIDDLNGDNFEDYIVSAPEFGGFPQKSRAGMVSAFASGISPPFDLIWEREGVHGSDYLGWSLSIAQDVNGDGIRDILAGAPGSPIITGNANGTGKAHLLSGRDGAILFSIVGENVGDRFGWSVASLDDINNDGIKDFIVGAPAFDVAGQEDAGKVYIYDVQGNLLRTITDSSQNNHFGKSVADVGDFNRDGLGDFLVGAPNVDSVGSNNGRATIYSGVDGSVLWSGDGPISGGRFGWAAAP